MADLSRARDSIGPDLLPSIDTPPQLPLLLEEDRLLKPVEAAEMMGASARSINRWVEEGRLACIRLPSHHRRFHRSAVLALIAELTEEAEQAAAEARKVTEARRIAEMVEAADALERAAQERVAQE